MKSFMPSARTRALYYYFGWQGGTVHQLAAETGLKVGDILSRALPERVTECSLSVDSCLRGFIAIRTCDLEWRRNTLAPKHLGDWDYWSSVIVGFWATGPLDGLNDRYPEHS